MLRLNGTVCGTYLKGFIKVKLNALQIGIIERRGKEVVVEMSDYEMRFATLPKAIRWLVQTVKNQLIWNDGEKIDFKDTISKQIKKGEIALPERAYPDK